MNILSNCCRNTRWSGLRDTRRSLRRRVWRKSVTIMTNVSWRRVIICREVIACGRSCFVAYRARAGNQFLSHRNWRNVLKGDGAKRRGQIRPLCDRVSRNSSLMLSESMPPSLNRPLITFICHANKRAIYGRVTTARFEDISRRVWRVADLFHLLAVNADLNRHCRVKRVIFSR